MSRWAGSSPANSGKSPTSSRGLEAEVEARPARRGGLPGLHLAPQIVVQLLADQALGVERLILGRLHAQRRLAQEAPLERVGIGGILEAQRVQRLGGRGPALADDLAEQLADPLAEHERHLAGDEAGQLLEHHAADQQQLEAVGQARDQRPVEAQVAVQPVREPEAPAERQLAPRRADVAEPAAGAGAVDDRLGVGQQALEDLARHRAVAEMREDQLALLVGEREQAERDPVAVGDLGIEGVVAGRLGDPLLVGTEHVARSAPGRSGSRRRSRRSRRAPALSASAST